MTSANDIGIGLEEFTTNSQFSSGKLPLLAENLWFNRNYMMWYTCNVNTPNDAWIIGIPYCGSKFLIWLTNWWVHLRCVLGTPFLALSHKQFQENQWHKIIKQRPCLQCVSLKIQHWRVASCACMSKGPGLECTIWFAFLIDIFLLIQVIQVTYNCSDLHSFIWWKKGKVGGGFNPYEKY